MMTLLLPRSIRPHRGALARRGLGGGRGVRAKMAKSKKRGRTSKRGRSRRGRNGKRGGRTGDPPLTDVVTDDAASDPAAAGEAGAGGEVGHLNLPPQHYYLFQVHEFFNNLHLQVCEVLMFDRGDGTYSLQFIQNKC